MMAGLILLKGAPSDPYLIVRPSIPKPPPLPSYSNTQACRTIIEVYMTLIPVFSLMRPRALRMCLDYLLLILHHSRNVGPRVTSY